MFDFMPPRSLLVSRGLAIGCCDWEESQKKIDIFHSLQSWGLTLLGLVNIINEENNTSTQKRTWLWNTHLPWELVPGRGLEENEAHEQTVVSSLLPLSFIKIYIYIYISISRIHFSPLSSLWSWDKPPPRHPILAIDVSTSVSDTRPFILHTTAGEPH